MTFSKLIIGSRASSLALTQVEEIKSLLKAKGVNISFEIKTYQSTGDQDKKTPLTDIKIPDNFFTDALDEALLKKEIDIAIHSAKDLPQDLAEGLEIFALTRSLDDTDSFVGKVNFNDLSKGAKVGTSSLIRQKNIKELNSDIEIIDIRGTIQERLKLIEQGVCEGIIVATAALKRLGLAHLIKDILPWEATALQGQLAIVGRREDQELKKIFSSIDVRREYGRVILVGAGPGDPELMTLKGVKALKTADCIFYDYLIDKDLLKHAPQAEQIYVGKRKGDHTLSQNELSKLLRHKAMDGKTIVRLKGGDPFIFGRGADELAYLRGYHIPVEVIPGISSATGIPSGLGIPLTARGISSSVAFVSGHSEEESHLPVQPIDIPNVDTIVFLMGLTKLNMIIQSLRESHWPDDTPTMIISRGTRIDEKIVVGTIENIQKKVKDHDLHPPALIVVGSTIKFWQGKGSYGEKILYTGTNPDKYQSLGSIVHHPMIEIKQAALTPEQRRSLLDNLYGYHMILLTSRCAVKYFFAILKESNVVTGILKNKDFVAIGQDTAQALQEHDFDSVLIPPVATSEGLLKVLKERYDLKGKKILFPRSSLPNPYLKEELMKFGSQVDELTVYENSKPSLRPLPPDGIRKILFSSPSTVKNFLEDYGTIPKGWEIFSKGPVTQKYLENNGYESEILIYESI